MATNNSTPLLKLQAIMTVEYTVESWENYSLQIKLLLIKVSTCIDKDTKQFVCFIKKLYNMKQLYKIKHGISKCPIMGFQSGSKVNKPNTIEI